MVFWIIDRGVRIVTYKRETVARKGSRKYLCLEVVNEQKNDSGVS